MSKSLSQFLKEDTSGKLTKTERVIKQAEMDYEENVNDLYRSLVFIQKKFQEEKARVESKETPEEVRKNFWNIVYKVRDMRNAIEKAAGDFHQFK